jgi:cell division ATPase FtsA
MQIDIKEAEDFKRSYGTALLDKNSIPDNSPVDMLFLSDIINARYEEIFEKVNDHLKDIEKDGKLPG